MGCKCGNTCSVCHADTDDYSKVSRRLRRKCIKCNDAATGKIPEIIYIEDDNNNNDHASDDYVLKYFDLEAADNHNFGTANSVSNNEFIDPDYQQYFNSYDDEDSNPVFELVDVEEDDRNVGNGVSNKVGDYADANNEKFCGFEAGTGSSNAGGGSANANGGYYLDADYEMYCNSMSAAGDENVGRSSEDTNKEMNFVDADYETFCNSMPADNANVGGGSVDANKEENFVDADYEIYCNSMLAADANAGGGPVDADCEMYCNSEITGNANADDDNVVANKKDSLNSKEGEGEQVNYVESDYVDFCNSFAVANGNGSNASGVSVDGNREEDDEENYVDSDYEKYFALEGL